MSLSKNNPAIRDNMRLYVYCPDCPEGKDGRQEMALVKRVPGGMFYVCRKCEKAHPVTKGSYKLLPHAWMKKK